jgi:DNA polymerase-3 subunit gamma/tau
VNLARSLQNGTVELKKKIAEPAGGNGHLPSAPQGTAPSVQVTSNNANPVSAGAPVSVAPPIAAAPVPVASSPVPVVKENGSQGYKPTAAAKPTVKINVDFSELEKQLPTADKKVADIIQEVLPRENKPFTKEQLENYWKAFAQSRITDGGYNSEQVILNKPIELAGNGTTILLKLDSQTQMSQLNDFKPVLLEYLRKNMKNFSIDLQAEIASQDVKKMIYTSQEKFRYLAEKHPVLQDLKARLGLDLEF